MNLKQKLIYATLGFVGGNLIMLSIFFGIKFIQTNQTEAREVDIEKAIELIASEQIKEVSIKGNEVIFVKNDDTTLISTIKSDPTRELIYQKVANSPKRISISEEGISNGWGWIILLNFFPVTFLLIIIGLLAGIFIRLGKNKTLR